MNQANFLLGYEVITMIIVLVTTKEKALGTNFNQENWMLVIRLVMINLSLTQDSKSESGKSGNFIEILDLGGDRTIVFLTRGSQLIRSFSMQQTLHWV